MLADLSQRQVSFFYSEAIKGPHTCEAANQRNSEAAQQLSSSAAPLFKT
jgi:hypothetical protein